MLTTSTDFALSNSQPNGRKQGIKFPVGQKVPDTQGEAMSVGMGGSVGGGMPRTKSKEYMDTVCVTFSPVFLVGDVPRLTKLVRRQYRRP
eukprot:3937539-Rhodomonas_salina.1